jgi:gluconolactonase
MMIRRPVILGLAGTAAAMSAWLVVVTGTASAERTARPEPGEAIAAPRAAALAACETDPLFGDPLPSPQVAATQIAGSFTFLEGPVWLAAQGRLLVSDIQNATGPERVQPASIRALTPPDAFDVFVASSGSNGLALSADGGRVLAATHDQRSISSFDPSTGARGVVADNFQGRRFNSPNDLAVHSNGTVYFSDPNFQRGGRSDELAGVTGVYRVSNGQVSLVDDSLAQPNGVVLSPDQQTLYVGAFNAGKIFKYEVLADGSTGARTEFASVNSPDGGTIDCAGNVYWASHNEGGVHVFAPDGRELGTITAGANATNAAFGGPDGRTLFITSGRTGAYSVYRTELNVPGLPY